MHKSTFAYLDPTDKQKGLMSQTRMAFSTLVETIDPLLPEGPDKTYLLRKLRECAMWANIAITRQPDGSPRD